MAEIFDWFVIAGELSMAQPLMQQSLTVNVIINVIIMNNNHEQQHKTIVPRSPKHKITKTPPFPSSQSHKDTPPTPPPLTKTGLVAQIQRVSCCFQC